MPLKQRKVFSKAAQHYPQYSKYFFNWYWNRGRESVKEWGYQLGMITYISFADDSDLSFMLGKLN